MPIKGIIYRIFNTVDDKVYVGSTTKQLHQRMKDHKNASIKTKFANMPIYVHINNIGFENFEIEPIKVVTVNNKKELLDKEYTEIRKNNKSKSLNIHGYGRDKEHRQLQLHNWYLKNKENPEWHEKQKIRYIIKGKKRRALARGFRELCRIEI